MPVMGDVARRRILIVSPAFPYPLIWGFGIRVYQFLRLLGRRHQVTLLAYARPDEAEAVAALRSQAICESIITVPLPSRLGQGARLDQLASLLTPGSHQVLRLRTAGMQAAISRLLAAEWFDVVQVESSQMAAFVFHPARAMVLDEHNIEYELLQRAYHAERSPARKLFNWLEYLKFRRQEQRAWREVHGCVLTSPREQAIVRDRAPLLATTVVPNGVDVDYFQPAVGGSDPTSIVFSGLIRYRPNADAVIYFIQAILPLIWRARPDVVFRVVGVDPPEEVRRLAGPNVLVTGTVPDVRPYLARASVVVVPLRMGSGTRLKVLDGLAMAKPIVSTSVGCEGIAVRDGDHLLIRDAPADFALAVLDLLADPARAAGLGRRGRALVEQEYGWEALVRGLERFHDETLARRRGEAPRPC